MNVKRVVVSVTLFVVLAIAVFCSGVELSLMSMRDCFHIIMKVIVVGSACAEMAVLLWCLVRK